MSPRRTRRLPAELLRWKSPKLSINRIYRTRQLERADSIAPGMANNPIPQFNWERTQLQTFISNS